MSCGTAAPANRNEFIAAERAFSICFGKHVGSIAIPCAPLLHKTQSDPCCTVGFVWIPPCHRRLHFTRIVISFYITVTSCLFVLMQLLRNCPQGHGAAGWSLETWGDFIQISIWRKRESRVNSGPLRPICLPLFNLHSSSLRSTSGVLSTATPIYHSSASSGQKLLTHCDSVSFSSSLSIPSLWTGLWMYGLSEVISTLQKYIYFWLFFFIGTISKHP